MPSKSLISFMLSRYSRKFILLSFYYKEKDIAGRRIYGIKNILNKIARSISLSALVKDHKLLSEKQIRVNTSIESKGRKRLALLRGINPIRSLSLVTRLKSQSYPTFL